MRWRDKVGEEGVGGCSEVISRTYSIKQSKTKKLVQMTAGAEKKLPDTTLATFSTHFFIHTKTQDSERKKERKVLSFLIHHSFTGQRYRHPITYIQSQQVRSQYSTQHQRQSTDILRLPNFKATPQPHTTAN
ncbi:hypothetical protein AAZX31_06G089100 [Glycine max]